MKGGCRFLRHLEYLEAIDLLLESGQGLSLGEELSLVLWVAETCHQTLCHFLFSIILHHCGGTTFAWNFVFAQKCLCFQPTGELGGAFAILLRH